MIEFKAECGHTIRAKDDDAGHTVRCTYCGQETGVPDGGGDALDYLFDDVESSSASAQSPRRRRPGRKPSLFTRRAPRSSNPYAIIVRMCYAAALIALVFFVSKKYLLPLFDPGGVSERIANAPTGRRSRSSISSPTPPAEPARKDGLLSRKSAKGLYVGSTPPGASAYCIEASKAPERGCIREVSGVLRAAANSTAFKVPDGTYVVEVAILWNERSLNNPDLPNYQSYLTLRRSIVKASYEERVRLLRDYFVPDGATYVFVDQTEDQVFIVRQYRDIQVRNGRSKGVRSLFLPRIALPGRDTFSIAQLVQHYIPKEKTYGFSKVQARIELDFYFVPDSDRLFVIEALERIGLVPYVTPDGVLRLFKIGIDDGAFAMKILSEA